MKTSVEIVRIGRRAQITVPKILRHELGLDEGDHVAFIRREHGWYVQPLARTLRELRGSVPAEPAPPDFERVRGPLARGEPGRGTDPAADA